MFQYKRNCQWKFIGKPKDLRYIEFILIAKKQKQNKSKNRLLVWE